MKIKKKKLERRHGRSRVKISRTAARPRLYVFRSLKHIQAQLIDDIKGHTLLLVSDFKLKGNKSDRAKETGKLLAQAALKKGIKKVVFDRAGHKYHGRVKALAEGARETGLEF